MKFEITYPHRDESRRTWVFSDGSTKDDAQLPGFVGHDPMSPESAAYMEQMRIDWRVAVRPRRHVYSIAHVIAGGGLGAAGLGTAYFRPQPGMIYHTEARLEVFETPRRPYTCGYCRRENGHDITDCPGCGAPKEPRRQRTEIKGPRGEVINLKDA